MKSQRQLAAGRLSCRYTCITAPFSIVLFLLQINKTDYRDIADMMEFIHGYLLVCVEMEECNWTR